MTSNPDNQTRYWDTNLDPANLGATGNTVNALEREIRFARDTPDIQQMIDWVTAPVGKIDTVPPRILDVGSGLGTAAVLLREHGATVIAVDISHSRLAAMRSATDALATPQTKTTSKIFAIKARAEALPFRDHALDGACSRAVLIHTDLPGAADEIARVLKPAAPVAFSEVMACNPLVNIYRRTLAPTEWQSITTYFTDAEINTLLTRFPGARDKRFYQFSFLAFVFQYAIPWRAGFRGALKVLRAIDRIIGRLFPSYRNYAWFVLITGRNRQS